MNDLVFLDPGLRGNDQLKTNPAKLFASKAGECRNPNLQKMFAMLGRGERAGSGVDKIKSGWRSQHWRAPLIRVQHQPDRVEITLPLVSLLQPTTIEHLRQRFGSRLDALTPAEIQALAIAKEEGIVSNRRLQDVSTEHRVEISRMLQGLVESGFLGSDNKRRWTSYRLVGEDAGSVQQQALLFELGSGGAPVAKDPGGSEHSGRDSEHLGRDSEHSGRDSEHMRRDSEHSGGDSEPLETRLSSELAAAAAEVANRGKAPSQLIRRTILALCRDRFLSAEDLGRLLHRHPNGLRQRFLTPLVTEGRLRLKHPGSSTRPDQAYITVPEAAP